MIKYNLCDDPMGCWRETELIRSGCNYVWFASDYQDGGYDGDGQAVALREDGMLDVYESLCHCSCYGPLENKVITVSREEYLRQKDDVLSWRIEKDLDNKVRELLGAI